MQVREYFSNKCTGEVRWHLPSPPRPRFPLRLSRRVVAAMYRRACAHAAKCEQRVESERGERYILILP